MLPTQSGCTLGRMSRINEITKQIEALKKEQCELQAASAGGAVDNYFFEGAAGAVSLSDLFGDHSDLVLVHNMGHTCPYCSLWADGFSGQLHHILQRSAFAMISPDEVEVQKAFASKRGWKFTMAQDKEQRFSKDMGYLRPYDGSDENSFWPGVTSFHKSPDGKLFKINQAIFGPGDDFCPVWPFLNLLKGGAGSWEPR